jgi:hypothetical protein
LELGLCRSPRDGVAAKADFSNFLRNVAPDFLQYISGDPKQRRPKQWKELVYEKCWNFCESILGKQAWEERKRSGNDNSPRKLVGYHR